jgi:N-acetylglucosamine malate deacetylase 1
MTVINKIKNKLRDSRFLRFTLIAVVFFAGIGCLLYPMNVPPVMAQSAVESLPNAVMPQSGQKVLIFSPHPDDETIGVGGYIAQSIANGAEVEIVLVTNGDFHGNEQVRYAEFRKATQILGVRESNLIFLGFPDRRLNKIDPNTLLSTLTTQIDQYNPDILIYPNTRDANSDHSTIGKVVEEILKADPRKMIDYEYLVHYKHIWPRPREFAPKLDLSPPDRLINVDTSWEKITLSQKVENLKSEAIRAYDSQLDNPWLNGLLLSSIRRNELLAAPK